VAHSIDSDATTHRAPKALGAKSREPGPPWLVRRWNALANTLRLCPYFFCAFGLSVIHLPSSSGEADPPKRAGVSDPGYSRSLLTDHLLLGIRVPTMESGVVAVSAVALV
jgi:hypothetical protein